MVEDAGSLIDAAEALADDADDSNEIESLPLEPGRSDVVRIMNLHKAKGLEADVVFLADPCGGFKPRVDVHIERKGEVAHGWFQVVRRSEFSFASTLLGEHADWATHAAAEEPYLEAEQNRLLYVAATRARQMVIVSRWTGKAWHAGVGRARGLPRGGHRAEGAGGGRASSGNAPRLLSRRPGVGRGDASQGARGREGRLVVDDDRSPPKPATSLA